VRGRGVQCLLLMNGMAPSDPAGDARAVQIIREMADLAPDSAARLAAAGVPCLADCTTFADLPAAELAVIASPIPFHADQTCTLLRRGLAVLVEKPAAATLTDLDRMIAAAADSGRPCGVGFQWSWAEPTRRLKADLLAGRFGRGTGLRALTLWPRPRSYYLRAGWAGRRHDAAGRPVFDEVLMNATAHFLHHALFLLGPAADAAATPSRSQAELYRAHTIETFDAAALDLEVAGVPVSVLAAHCCAEANGPRFCIETDGGRIAYEWSDGQGEGFVVTTSDGQRLIYGDPEAAPHDKLWRFADQARTCSALDCPLAAARPHLAVCEHLRGLPVTVIPPVACDELPCRDSTVPVPRGLDHWFQARWSQTAAPRPCWA